MGERIGRIGQIETVFLNPNQKKSVSICPIRPIRSSIVSAFSKAEITEKDSTHLLNG
jgi:hypothetical protein